MNFSALSNKTKSTRNFINHWFFSRGVIILFLVAIVPITWFQGNFLIAGGDHFAEVNSKFILNNALYVWTPQGFGGLPKASPEILYATLFSISQAGGLTPVIWEQAVFYFLFLAAGLSMFYLALALSPEKKLVPILAALLYMTNVWAIVAVWTVPYTFQLLNVFAYSFFPLMLAFFIKAMKSKKWLKLILCSALVSILISPAYTDPVWALTELIFLFIAMLYYVLLDKNRLNSITKFFAFLGLWLLINAFWILPILPVAQDFIGSPYRLYSPDLAAFTSHSINVIDSLRITGPNGYWTLSQTVIGDPIIPWIHTSYSTVFSVIGFILPITAFLSLLLRPKDRFVIFFSIISILSIIMITGSNPPLGSLLVRLLQQSGLISLFRDPFNKFGCYLALSYSYLCAVFLSFVIRGDRNKK